MYAIRSYYESRPNQIEFFEPSKKPLVQCWWVGTGKRLPDVMMGIDQARDYYLVLSINHFVVV